MSIGSCPYHRAISQACRLSLFAVAGIISFQWTVDGTLEGSMKVARWEEEDLVNNNETTRLLHLLSWEASTCTGNESLLAINLPADKSINRSYKLSSISSMKPLHIVLA